MSTSAGAGNLSFLAGAVPLLGDIGAGKFSIIQSAIVRRYRDSLHILQPRPKGGFTTSNANPTTISPNARRAPQGSRPNGLARNHGKYL